ncbi:hypothetical protein IGI04_038910 [Brassica rapa subsp. trilocularis]|uniref:Metallothionein-like protein n=1 Tax=Brassica rapa subsp. trilocularis TaxID=1813537 RepID=A0ABQ7LN96_BRACM|nr:hypothetical protein IGI04_038910 [Brassica rapa subsp. trilocularis]
MAGSNCGCGSGCKCVARRTTTRSATTAAADQTVAVGTAAAVNVIWHNMLRNNSLNLDFFLLLCVDCVIV